MNNKSTLDPLKVFLTGDKNYVVGIGKKDGTGVADCGFGLWGGDNPEALEYAKLFAAAPETAAERDKLRAENQRLRDGYQELLTIYIAERDCLYDSVTNINGEYNTDDDQRQVAEMDALIDRSQADLNHNPNVGKKVSDHA